MAKGQKDFSDLLDRPAGTAERPKPLPAGSYTCIVAEQRFGTARNQEQTPQCVYSLVPLSPGEDVDADALEAVRGWDKRKRRAEFFLDEDSLWRLDDFLEKCGVNVNGRSYKECIPEAKNTEIIAFFVQNPSTKEGDDTIFNNITGYAPA